MQEKNKMSQPTGLPEYQLQLLAGATSFAAWSLGSMGGAIALPLLWQVARSRRSAFVVAMTYYLVGAWVIPQSARVFFSDSQSYLFGIVLWLLSSVILSSVWAFLWAPLFDGTRVPWRLLTAVLLISVPPIGMIGWLSPLLSASFFFPGWGLGSIAAVLAVWCIPRVFRGNKKAWISAILVMMCFSLVALNTYKPPINPQGWWAINMNMGKIPDSVGGQVQRQLDLVEQTKAMLKVAPDASMILLPEQIAGRVDDPMLIAWRQELPYIHMKKGQLLMVGMERPIGSNGLYKDALMVVDGGKIVGYASARQSVPVAMWRPWYPHQHAPADWLKSNLLPVPWNGKIEGASLLFCYEEFLVWPVVSTFMVQSPKAIVSVANDWWASPQEKALQTRHIEAWARIFGVPLLRAVNG